MQPLKRYRDPIIRRLRELDLFAECSRSELELLARNLTEHRSPAGEILIQEGRTGREVAVLVEGKATVLRAGKPVAQLGPGDFAGEIALLDHGPRTATVVADTDILALVCTPQEFTNMIEGAPGFARALLPEMARRIRVADSQLVTPV